MPGKLGLDTGLDPMFETRRWIWAQIRASGLVAAGRIERTGQLDHAGRARRWRPGNAFSKILDPPMAPIAESCGPILPIRSFLFPRLKIPWTPIASFSGSLIYGLPVPENNYRIISCPVNTAPKPPDKGQRALKMSPTAKVGLYAPFRGDFRGTCPVIRFGALSGHFRGSA